MPPKKKQKVEADGDLAQEPPGTDLASSAAAGSSNLLAEAPELSDSAIAELLQGDVEAGGLAAAVSHELERTVSLLDDSHWPQPEPPKEDAYWERLEELEAYAQRAETYAETVKVHIGACDSDAQKPKWEAIIRDIVRFAEVRNDTKQSHKSPPDIAWLDHFHNTLRQYVLSEVPLDEHQMEPSYDLSSLSWNANRTRNTQKKYSYSGTFKNQPALRCSGRCRQWFYLDELEAGTIGAGFRPWQRNYMYVHKAY